MYEERRSCKCRFLVCCSIRVQGHGTVWLTGRNGLWLPWQSVVDGLGTLLEILMGCDTVARNSRILYVNFY